MAPIAKHADEAEESGLGRLSTLGAFIWQDRERLLAAAQRYHGDPAENTVECRLRGGSMSGAIPAGARIRICFARGPHRVGDVIAFMIDARIVVHRIVYRRRRKGARTLLITRGDVMMLPDPPIDTGAILGKVTGLATGTDWCPIGSQVRLPRRERVLAYVLLAASAFLLRFSAKSARRFTYWLDATDRRFAWIRKFLY